jgi:hypothetical protein
VEEAKLKKEHIEYAWHEVYCLVSNYPMLQSIFVVITGHKTTCKSHILQSPAFGLQLHSGAA